MWVIEASSFSHKSSSFRIGVSGFQCLPEISVGSPEGRFFRADVLSAVLVARPVTNAMCKTHI
jgi:hypothetical protein